MEGICRTRRRRRHLTLLTFPAFAPPHPQLLSPPSKKSMSRDLFLIYRLPRFLVKKKAWAWLIDLLTFINYHHHHKYRSIFWLFFFFLRSMVLYNNSFTLCVSRYLSELLAERHKLGPFLPLLPHCCRLINQGQFRTLNSACYCLSKLLLWVQLQCSNVKTLRSVTAQPESNDLNNFTGYMGTYPFHITWLCEANIYKTLKVVKHSTIRNSSLLNSLNRLVITLTWLYVLSY